MCGTGQPRYFQYSSTEDSCKNLGRDDMTNLVNMWLGNYLVEMGMLKDMVIIPSLQLMIERLER